MALFSSLSSGISPLLTRLLLTSPCFLQSKIQAHQLQECTTGTSYLNFLKLNYSVAKSTIKEITSGNFHSLTRFLLELHQRFNPKRNERKEKEESGASELNLKKLQVLQSYDQAQNFIELVVVILSDRLGLTPKQAVSTLSDSAKYYAHMVVKGVKNSFEDILNLLDGFDDQMSQLVHYAEKDPEKHTEFLLDLIKPTLISRQSDVARQGANLMYKLIEESQRYNTKNLVYQILCKQSVGFDFLYMALKRHPDLSQNFARFLFPLVRHALPDFFEVHLRKTINNQQEYVKMLLRLEEGFSKDPESKTAIKQSGLLDIWLKNCDSALGNKRSREEEPINEQTKILYLQLLCNLWKDYSSEIDQDEAEEMLVRGINELKKNTRKDIYTIKIPALIRIFDFLHFLADGKNRMASVVYKKLIFLLIQNHEESEVRQIILENFGLILRKYQTIPVQFLLDPLLRQLINSEGKSYVLNMFDFQFLEEVCAHPRMDAAAALSYLEYFSKLYIHSFIYAQLTIRLIDILTRRFCQQQAIIQFLKKTVDSTLNQYGVLTFNKKKLKKEQQLANKQKQSLSIELIKLFIQLQHQELRQYILTKVTGLYLLWMDNKRHDNKGLKYLIQLFGDLDELCLQFKVQNNKIFSRERPSGQIPSESDIYSYKPTPKSQAYHEVQYMKQKGIGYKDRSRPHKTHADNLVQVNNIKPAPRALEQLERIKQRIKDGASRKRLKEDEELQKVRERNSINNIQLMQRNLSLGYTKVTPKLDNQIIFDFNSVKAKQLKNANLFYHPEDLETIDKDSTQVILKQYNKDIKALFLKAALVSSTTDSSRRDEPSAVMSFTEAVKLLNQKGFGFINKLVISDMISSINHHKRRDKNILYGMEQVDFPQFLIKFTDHLIQNQQSPVEVPFGIRLQKLLKTLFTGQNFYENRFRVKEDPKVFELRELLRSGQEPEIQIPEGYKKVKETQVRLLHEIAPEAKWGVPEKYKLGYQLADWLVHRCIGVHVMTPGVKIQQNYNLIQIPKNIKVGKHQSQKKLTEKEETQQNLPQIAQSSKKVPVRPEKRSQSQRVIHKTRADPAVSAQQEKAKAVKRQKYLKQLNENLQRLRLEKKKKEEEEKAEQIRKKQQLRRKQNLHKQYLELNKQKIKERKAQEQEEERQRKEREERSKQRAKQEHKKKGVQFLNKHQEQIQKFAQKQNDKKKTLENSRQQRSKPSSTPKPAQTHPENDKLKMMQVRNSLQNGSLGEIISQYDKQFNELFQAYWAWDQKRIDLKGIALMLKDFKISPEYILPKTLADTYKSISRGQSLEFSSFTECLAKCSYRSPKLIEEGGAEEEITGDILRLLCEKMRMKEWNYKEVIHNVKNHLEGI